MLNIQRAISSILFHALLILEYEMANIRTGIENNRHPHSENSAKLKPLTINSYPSSPSILVLYIGANKEAYDNIPNNPLRHFSFIVTSKNHIHKGLIYFQNFLGKKTTISIPPKKCPLLYSNSTTRGWTYNDLIKKNLK